MKRQIRGTRKRKETAANKELRRIRERERQTDRQTDRQSGIGGVGARVRKRQKVFIDT